jgi:hypothetical protein
MPQSLEVGYAAQSRRSFMLFLFGAALFVAAITAALCYGVSRPQTVAIEAQERLAIDQCWRSSQAPGQSPSSRRFQQDACHEMETQYGSKYEHRR